MYGLMKARIGGCMDWWMYGMVDVWFDGYIIGGCMD